MFSLVCTVVIPFLDYSTQLHQIPDEECRARVRIHACRKEDDNQPLVRPDSEEA